MYYLKCNNCGHLNEIKTEYLVFCGKCNKKLQNNFNEWKSRNPEKSLNDYKSLICVSDIEINTTPAVKRKIRFGYKPLAAFVISAVIASFIGLYFSEKFLDFIRFGKVPKSIIEQTWITEKYGLDGLTVSTPYKLNSVELPFPEQVKQIIENSNSYMSQTANNFVISVNSVRYKQELLGSFSLQGAANGSVAEMKMQPGVSEFEYKEDYIFVDKLPGFKHTGTYIQDKVKIEFINIGFNDGVVLYQVLVGHKADDDVGRKVAQRVIESIKVDRNKAI